MRFIAYSNTIHSTQTSMALMKNAFHVRSSSAGCVLRKLTKCQRSCYTSSDHSSQLYPGATAGEFPVVAREEKDVQGFPDLLRSSKLISSGQIVGKRVPALITAVVGDKLYVDFGGKFHGVVPRPVSGDVSVWRRGVWVEVMVRDLEQTHQFLGSSKHTSLLEADIELDRKSVV